LIVALAAAAAAAVTVGVVVLTSDDPAARVGKPPPLSLVVRGSTPTARDVRRAQRLYAHGRLDEARTLFDRHRSAEARVGSAFTRWPGETLARLEELPPGGAATLHLGIALAALGREADARRELRRVKRVAPDTPYAIRADDFLHPEFVPGLPFFLASRAVSGDLRNGIEQQRRPRGVGRGPFR
jgi:hypothetical protein